MKFFMADPHFGHQGIIPMMARVDPAGQVFSCIEEHDYNVISEINNRVCRDDELIICGDFAWDKPGKFRQQIKCKHIKLIMGNHDSQTKCANVFGQVYDQYTTKIRSADKQNYLKVVCSHYPHAYWDGSHKGWGHVYGHVHGQREHDLDLLFPGRRALDIGVDNLHSLFGSYRPISEVELYKYFMDRPGHDQVSHYIKYQEELYQNRGISPRSI
jgi:calcineurin-like phosphoesterase family protein